MLYNSINEVIKECIEIELSEGSHADEKEDYNSSLDFYLSNTEGQGYRDFLKEFFELSESEAFEVQKAVIEKIKNLNV